MICYKPAASLVLTSKIGRPRAVPETRWVLFVWQRFISPQSGLQQVMYRKDPNPDTVSSVTLDNCSGLSQTLHPRSRASASNSSSTTRLPLILPPFWTRKASLRLGGSSTEIFTNFTRRSTSLLLRKRPFLSWDRRTLFAFAILDVAMLCAVADAQCKTGNHLN